MKEGPYRGFKPAPLRPIPLRTPVARWRTEAPLREKTPKKRVGQYVGPLREHESIAIEGLRFEFNLFSDRTFFLIISDDFSGERLQTVFLAKGASIIMGPDNTEINILAYFVSEESIRCSIIIEKNRENPSLQVSTVCS